MNAATVRPPAGDHLPQRHDDDGRPPPPFPTMHITMIDP